MIYLQRRLMLCVSDQAIADGNAPKHLKPGQYYPVVGYSVQMKTKNQKATAGSETASSEKVEDIQVLYVVNENRQLAGVYPSRVDVYVEPLDTVKQ